MAKIVCVVPSIREDCMARFREEWGPLFRKHDVKLITVWDGGDDILIQNGFDVSIARNMLPSSDLIDLFCRRTDSCRNWGFLWVAQYEQDCTHVLTLDDDCYPIANTDPIEEHLAVLNTRVPTSWMNTAMGAEKSGHWVRGFPSWAKEESRVAVSHGVWYNVPDFDGETQLRLSKNGTTRLPYVLDFYRGAVPKGVYMPVCGMNLMFTADVLPWVYFAPMGPDTKVEGLHRFGDIWMGVGLKKKLDGANLALYTGEAAIFHSRASDPHKNVKQEALGKRWHEWASMAWEKIPHQDTDSPEYEDWTRYRNRTNLKATQYASLIRSYSKSTKH